MQRGRGRIVLVLSLLLAWPCAFTATGVHTKEQEPNDTVATAQLLPSSGVVVRGTIVPGTDVDYYAFGANAGDRVYALVITAGSSAALGNNASVLTIYNTDGVTALESDDNNGSLGTASSCIAGRVLPAAGIYYIAVRSNSGNQIRPYDLYLRVHSGVPAPEVEPNDGTTTAMPLPDEGWVSGTVITGSPDYFSINLNAGDTVCLMLDLDPDRDGLQANYNLSFGQFNGTNVMVDDDGLEGGADSEALAITVKSAGTYYALVDRTSGINTYHLSATVFPQDALINPVTYTSTNVPGTIPAGPGTLTSTLTVPGHPRVGTIRVALNITHTNMADLDVSLISPSGNVVGLFHDINVGNTTMDLILDDAAAIPIGTFASVQGVIYQPDVTCRLRS